ncbi:anthranilate phosphoribosyltransferase [Desulfofarcimen acetoxidans DSM 771]|uniref:Anthranilate phosphoribosyltransferase n=1 Tax=Desulfofarcimen acetoxidans (strain ATCC 49208 / DSM 771 / KCTC 5769 / VKM B-1644 / 5575) TaxID=485916 RepID=C8VW89_DESAS|nr:anthranilate phosphoribosyltransferase [Desulfofarcimen acetoxidans]ACV62441.1 anthranilate phosphoribosyltransferase [Desulfofarcimen acetoxidans DSM 771]
MLIEQAKEFGHIITKLINKEDLSRHEAKEAFSQILLNQQSEMQQGAFLAALTSKRETVEEIAGCWEAIYELDTVKVIPDVPEPLVDNCGTGMDTIKTFNISTAASIIAAAAGIRMAKHGARAITSVCGTIDILEKLGVDVECSPQIVKKSIEKAGIGIFNGMSPKVHPQALGRVLSQISFGTILNISGSLSNPALPRYGVRGVYSKELVKPVAQVMREIGYKKAVVVHGLAEDEVKGMDEASTLGHTIIAELRENGEIIMYSFAPEDIGIKRSEMHLLAPSENREEEVLRFLAVLKGEEEGARSDIVCLNAALILYLVNCNNSLEECYRKAKEIIFSGEAIKKLYDWVAEQNNEPEIGLERLNTLLKK